MSFLDRVNAKTAPAAAPAAEKKVNPLLKNKLKKKEDPAKAEAPKKKIMPLKKKTIETKPADEEVKTTTEEEVDTKEETKVTEEPEVTPEAEKEKPEAPKEEAKKEEKKTTKKPTPSVKKSAKKPVATTKKKESEEDFVAIDMPTTKMSFGDAVMKITSPFVDEEWEEFKEEVKEELNNIVIDNDMNPGTLKVTISELSILREKIWFSLQETKDLFDRLGSKDPEGLIERIKRVNLGSGNNDMERRRAGVVACMKYETDSGEINLYEVLDETRTRYTFLKSVMDSIGYKTNTLITMNGALKLEKDHVFRGE